jgi:3-hydroxyacyl-[acyl-carrier-protein] dehydratase
MSNAPAATVTLPVDVNRIISMLPHRYPFLLVDRVIAFEPRKSLVAIKNVTINEPFFQGHFPGHPVMPGVLIIEALAQASGVLTQLSDGGPGCENPLYYLVKVDKARFSQTVVPGDQLELHVTQKRMLRGMGLYECRAIVAGNEVASAEILCAERAR